jgi:hypothetical protein
LSENGRVNKVYGWIGSATRAPSFGRRPAFRLRAVLAAGALFAIGCGGSREGSPPDGSGGQSGSGGDAGVSGAAGTSGGSRAGTTGGGAAGPGGAEAGRGGASGAGGVTAGAGGTSSSGGGGGSAGSASTGGRGGSTGASGVGGRGGTTGAAGRGGALGAAGAAGSGGATGGSAGSSGVVNKVFNSCRFHFGALEGTARGSSALTQQIDIFTPGWMGQKDTFDMMGVCTETAAGGPLAGKIPVVVAYVAAFYAKRHFGRCDCNVTTCGANNDLCHNGAADIQQNLTSIVNVYKSYAQGFASCYGTTKPIIFEMEPDWYQYTITEQTQAMTEAQAGTIMGQFVDAVRQVLPNAVFSMDISPWTGSNGADNGAEWFSHFDMTKFTFINTSGGGTDATSTKIRAANLMTWAGVSKVTGKPILADTGYGVNGSSAGHDPNWDNVANINARIADGVLAITQYNPSSSWATTIGTVRSQLTTPANCP